MRNCLRMSVCVKFLEKGARFLDKNSIDNLGAFSGGPGLLVVSTSSVAGGYLRIIGLFG